MPIFVTGGAGFIGSSFIHFLAAERPDIEVIDLDALTYAGNMENLAGIDPARHRFIKGDICDPDAVAAAMPENCDAVFNFAAETHVDRSIASAAAFVRTNVLGTQVLLDAARAKNVRRFVHISTDEVFGGTGVESDELFCESTPIRPNSPYAASKAAAEMLVRAAAHTYGLDTVITRCGNNYGPRQHPEKFIPCMITNALRGAKLPLYGNGENIRDWIFVEGHCRAVWLAYEKGRAGESYNIGARDQRRNIDVAKAILDILGKDHSQIEFVADRPGHDGRYAIDPSKAETELGWRPMTDWETGIERTVKWYLSAVDRYV